MPADTCDHPATAGAQPLPDPDGQFAPGNCRNPPRLPALILAVALVIALVEILVLARTRGFSNESGITLRFLSIGFHPWFWVTSLYLIWCAAWRVMAIGRPGWFRFLIRGAALCAAVAALSVYGISWGFFLWTGQFADVEVIQF